MSNPKFALIRFTPLEPYFFGGESTHGALGADANYFSKSNLYPQQTTLLGVLRNLLRLASYPFGQKSFSPNDPRLTDFGHLIGISPLFLSRDNTAYFLQQALDRQDSQPFAIGHDAEKDKEWLLFDGESEFKSAARWQGYEKKKGLANEWISPDGEKVKPEQVFKAFVRPGIPKHELHRDVGGPGLFKQELIKMKAGWSFAVVATFDPTVEIEKLNGATAQLGGEKSIFQITVDEKEQGFEQIFPKEKMFYDADIPITMPRLVLVSDTEMPASAWQYVAAAVTETTDFRHFQTYFNSAHTQRHVKIGSIERSSPNTTAAPSDKKPMLKSAKFTLLQRGSVLVCQDTDALDNLEKALDIQPWKTAGFNHFFKYNLNL
jgi:CRISPR-associated protein Cmr3